MGCLGTGSFVLALYARPNTARHDELVSLVERMLELHKRSPRLPPRESIGTSRRKSPCSGPLEERQGYKIEPAADGRIDRLVYELYRLTEDEIRIAES
jgi:hypothetical protein